MLTESFQQFYDVKAEFTIETDGKVKRIKRPYLVKAVSVFDAETQVNEYLKHSTDPFVVVSVVLTKYEDVIGVIRETVNA